MDFHLVASSRPFPRGHKHSRGISRVEENMSSFYIALSGTVFHYLAERRAWVRGKVDYDIVVKYCPTER